MWRSPSYLFTKSKFSQLHLQSKHERSPTVKCRSSQDTVRPGRYYDAQLQLDKLYPDRVRLISSGSKWICSAPGFLPPATLPRSGPRCMRKTSKRKKKSMAQTVGHWGVWRESPHSILSIYIYICGKVIVTMDSPRPRVGTGQEACFTKCPDGGETDTHGSACRFPVRCPLRMPKTSHDVRVEGCSTP